MRVYMFVRMCSAGGVVGRVQECVHPESAHAHHVRPYQPTQLHHKNIAIPEGDNSTPLGMNRCKNV